MASCLCSLEEDVTTAGTDTNQSEDDLVEFVLNEGMAYLCLHVYRIFRKHSVSCELSCIHLFYFIRMY